MRLIHLADLHLGFRQYHRLTPTGINQREADVAHSFRRAIDQVIALKPDIVVVAGDIFHSVRPQNPAIIHGFTQFRRLTRELPDAIIVVVAGNHDRPRSSETGCILNLFAPLGIHVAAEKPERLTFPEHDLSIFAVPDLDGDIPALTPEPGVRHNVLVMHGEIAGMLPEYASRADRAHLEIPVEALGAPDWSYIALGHYHVHREIAPNAFYAGSLDYTSANPWGELIEESETGIGGKGFVEYDLETGTRRFHPVEPSRRLVDLPAVMARGYSASELDAVIAERVDGCDGGIDDRVVRIVVRDVPRHIVRDLDHRRLREFKRRALHFHLDTRRPEIIRRTESGAPGRRPTLKEMVESFLGRRSLESDIDRGALVHLGLRYLDEVSATPPPGQLTQSG